jgi:hypothetical protein
MGVRSSLPVAIAYFTVALTADMFGAKPFSCSDAALPPGRTTDILSGSLFLGITIVSADPIACIGIGSALLILWPGHRCIDKKRIALSLRLYTSKAHNPPYHAFR